MPMDHTPADRQSYETSEIFVLFHLEHSSFTPSEELHQKYEDKKNI